MAKELPLTIPHPRRSMQYEPVPVEDDELIKEIGQDAIGATDEQYWDLHDSIDPEKLDAFWSSALKELGAEAPEDATE